MPNPIVDEPVFTPDVVAPDGDDFMDDAADVVELAFQAFANRTRFLYEFINANVAIKYIVNTFTRKLIVNTEADDIPAYTTENAPPTNGWRPFLSAPCDSTGGRRVTVYAGQGDDVGAFAIVVNAAWQASPARWNRQNSGKVAIALFFTPSGDNSGLFFSMQPVAAGANWTAWPLGEGTNGTLRIGGAGIFGDSLAANRFILALKSITANEGFVVGDGFEYDFNGPRTRPRSIVPIANVCGVHTRTATGSVKCTSGLLAWTIRVPPGCAFGKVQVMHQKTSGSDTHFQLISRTGADWNPGDPGAPTTDTELDAVESSVGLHVTELDASIVTSDPSVTELQLVWDPPGDGANDEVHMISLVDWTEDGLRNEVL